MQLHEFAYHLLRQDIRENAVPGESLVLGKNQEILSRHLNLHLPSNLSEIEWILGTAVLRRYRMHNYIACLSQDSYKFFNYRSPKTGCDINQRPWFIWSGIPPSQIIKSLPKDWTMTDAGYIIPKNLSHQASEWELTPE